MIAGNGAAGMGAASAIRRTDERGRITVIGKEPYPFYSRIRLIDYLAGETEESGLVIHDEQWYEKNEIKTLLSLEASGLDTNRKEVSLSNGGKIKYDRLLLATGSVPLVPEIEGSGKTGVFTLRSMKDAIEIRMYAAGREEAVIIGGGLLGLETGYALTKRGMKAKVVEFLPRLLPRQTDSEAARMLEGRLKKMGFEFYLGASALRIFGKEGAEGVELEDGRKIYAGMAVISAGVRPDTALAASAGIKTEKGVVVDDMMRTSAPDVYAAGDCAEHGGVCYGIWPAAEEQGRTAGINMAGGEAIYRGTTPSNTLKVAGVGLVAGGNLDGGERAGDIVSKDEGKGIYRKLVVEEGRISGLVLFGDTSGARKIIKAMEEKRDVAGMLDKLENWDLSSL